MAYLTEPMRIVAFALLVLLGQVAAAQNSDGLQFERPESLAECLTPAASERGVPEYPKNQLRMKEGARVRVQLTFAAPDWPPRIKVLENTGALGFATAVEDHVQRYRLPCLPEGGVPVSVNQEFTFDPGDGRKVTYGSIQDGSACCADVKCINDLAGTPAYPKTARDRNIGGNLLAEIKFVRQNEEPVVRMIYGARSKALEDSVTEFVKQYRYLCPLPEGETAVATQRFAFRMEGASRYAFKDVDLAHFLAIVEPAGLVNAKFDFNKMGCPFDLALTVRQPYAINLVGEYGDSDPRRKRFINWVKGLTLPLPEAREPYLFDQTMRVSVPCLVLDL